MEEDKSVVSQSIGQKPKSHVSKARGNLNFVQVYGRKKTALAVATCKKGSGQIRVNGRPLDLIQPHVLKMKAREAILVLGQKYFKDVDIKVHVHGGGQVAQIYAVRQAIAKGLVAYYQKYVDEETKRTIKQIFLKYDRGLLVADPRKSEPKKFGGPGARSRYQKSYR